MQHLKFTKKFKVTKLTYELICHHGEIVIITQYHLLSKSIIYFVTSWYITTLYHWIIIHVCLCHPYVVFTWMFFRYQCFGHTFWDFHEIWSCNSLFRPKQPLCRLHIPANKTLLHTLLTVYHFGEFYKKTQVEKHLFIDRRK